MFLSCSQAGSVTFTIFAALQCFLFRAPSLVVKGSGSLSSRRQTKGIPRCGILLRTVRQNLGRLGFRVLGLGDMSWKCRYMRVQGVALIRLAEDDHNSHASCGAEASDGDCASMHLSFQPFSVLIKVLYNRWNMWHVPPARSKTRREAAGSGRIWLLMCTMKCPDVAPTAIQASHSAHARSCILPMQIATGEWLRVIAGNCW